MPNQQWQYPNTALVGGVMPAGGGRYYGTPGSSQYYLTPIRGNKGQSASIGGGKGQSASIGGGLVDRYMQMQVDAAAEARRLQEQRVSQAISALKYGMGLSLRNSPYSLAAQASPYLRDMANANLSVQYNQPDYGGFAALAVAQQNAQLMAQQMQQQQQMGGGGFPVFNYAPGMSMAAAQPAAMPAAQPQYPSWWGGEQVMSGRIGSNANFGGLEFEPDFAGANPMTSGSPPISGAQEDF